MALNPVLNEKKFQEAALKSTDNAMTIRGTVNKTAFLFALTLCAAVYSWGVLVKEMNVMPLVAIGGLGGFVLAIIMSFKPDWARYLAPAYALAEGLFLGVISAAINAKYAGIVFQAIGLTFGVFLAMLVLYRTGVLRATERFRSIVFTATAGIAIFYLLAWVLRMFNVDMPFLHEGGMFGIIFSLVVIGVAALNLILNFDMIEQGANYGAPKYMEWYAAFSLMVVLIWLYLEILRLLMKLNGGNRN